MKRKENFKCKIHISINRSTFFHRKVSLAACIVSLILRHRDEIVIPWTVGGSLFDWKCHLVINSVGDFHF